MMAPQSTYGARDPPTRRRRRRRRQQLAAPASRPTAGDGDGDGDGAGSSTKTGAAMASLPDDVLLDILSRLPMKLLFRYKCVSRAWRGLASACLGQIPTTLQGFFHGTAGAGGCGTKVYTSGGFFLNLLGGPAEPPVDPSFSFLTAKLPPKTDTIWLVDSCNGLVLFRHRRRRRRCSSSSGTRAAGTTTALGYIVCNPATKEWVSVSMSAPTTTVHAGEEDGDSDMDWMVTTAYILFDPAVSASRFQLVQFLLDQSGKDVLQVHTYSSDTREWTARAVQCWSNQTIRTCMSTFVNGMLHLSVTLRGGAEHRRSNVIVAVDGEGQQRRVIGWPEEERGSLVFLGQSQGLLHCVSGRFGYMTEVSIWVLKEDYGAAETEQWILKGRVSCWQLFGQADCSLAHSTVAIHPHLNLVFFYHLLERWLVSYDMDREEVRDLCTLHHTLLPVTPYVPYFGESSALAKKHSHC